MLVEIGYASAEIQDVLGDCVYGRCFQYHKQTERTWMGRLGSHFNRFNNSLMFEKSARAVRLMEKLELIS